MSHTQFAPRDWYNIYIEIWKHLKLNLSAPRRRYFRSMYEPKFEDCDTSDDSWYDCATDIYERYIDNISLADLKLIIDKAKATS